jgi:Sel1 repeat
MPVGLDARRVAAVAALSCMAQAAALAAEPTLPPVPNPVLEPEQRWAFDGFSILPPQEGDWFSLVKTRERGVLAKRGARGEQGVFATVVAQHVEAAMPTPEAFLEQMRARRNREHDATRVSAVRYDETLESREPPWCTRYRVEADEVVPWYASARVTEVLGRACLHPTIPGLVVDAAFAVRAALAEEASGAQVAAPAFLASVRFAPPPAGDPADVTAVNGAARAGDGTAALRLGAMYERGRGLPADPAAAERWYRVAAGAGEVDALYNLGVLHEQGIGRPRDPQAAVAWFRRASDQRDAQAQLNLGLLYYRGDGVDRDLAQARAFLDLAARNGSARARDLLERLSFAERSGPSP